MKQFELGVQADRAAIGTLLDWVALVCQECGLDIEATRRIAILVEELFLNTVNHGYAGKPGAAIQYRLSQGDDLGLELVQRDHAAAFDIARAAPQAATMERVGGLGIALIHGMSQGVQYRREGDMNITTISL